MKIDIIILVLLFNAVATISVVFMYERIKAFKNS
jgi:hypothetical protein